MWSDGVDTTDGKAVAKVVNPNVRAVDSISGVLSGKLSDDYDAKTLREERLEQYAGNDWRKSFY